MKLIEKSLNEMEQLERFQGSTFDTIFEEKIGRRSRILSLELTGKIQELQNEINCMNDSRDFQDAKSVRSGHSHVTSQPVSSPPHPVPGRNAKPYSGNAEPQRWAAKHLGHAWYIGKRFCKSSCVLFSTLSGGIESMEFTYIRTNTLTTGGERMRTKHQFRIRDASPGPSAKNSIIPGEVDSSKNYVADQQRLQISDFISTNPHTSNVCLLEDKIQD